MSSSSNQTKSFPSRAVKRLRLGFKKSCSRLASLLGPRSFQLFGVPSGLIEIESQKTLFPEESFELPIPQSIEKELFSGFKERQAEIPKLGFFKVPLGVATRLGGNLDRKGRLVKTYLRPVDGKSPENHDLFNFSQKRFFPKMIEEKRVISLVSGWQDMFYHWMYEVLPRLALIKDFEGKIYIDQGRRFQRESLALFGVDPMRIIDAAHIEGVRAKELIVPAVPPMPTKWVCDFLRDNIQVKTNEHRRLYLSRSDAEKRRILNEDELLPILEKYGFEVATTSNLPFAEQVKLFASAEIVVGPHGAGFSHLTFCKPKTPVLEIFAPAYTHRCYWQVAAAAGLSYHYMFGESEESGDPDFTVDPVKFEEGLKRALADR